MEQDRNMESNDMLKESQLSNYNCIVRLRIIGKCEEISDEIWRNIDISDRDIESSL